jgi:predicted nucleotide-binding protein (sugar kinase/HSP70/actin superfamily)
MKNYVEFTKAMRQDYTILMPNMLPRHFRLIREVLRGYGYNVDLLETEGQHIAETGLKYVHNDTCYPAILVIGQFIDALSSGLYDPHKVALLLFQTGGGCRASNYIFLLRKALERAGYGYVPVISFNLLGLERHSGFMLSPIALYRMFYAVVYGDIIMELVNQCKPYELAEGRSEALADQLTRELTQRIRSDISSS